MGARAGHFPGCSLGSQAPSLARGVPTPSPDPRRTPASRPKRPTSSMELGHRGPGCEQLAPVAANPQTPPSRPHHCEDPPVLPSVKGSPFTDGRTGGRPPGDGFCPSRGWVVSGQEAGPRRRKQAPPQEHPSGQRAPPPLEISGQVHRVPGLLSELREALPATHRTKRFPPWTTRPSSSPTPAEAECQGRTRDLGPGRGAGHGSAPGGAGPGGRAGGRAGGTLVHGPVLLWGVWPVPRLGG